VPTDCWTRTHYDLFNLCEIELAQRREQKSAAGRGHNRTFTVADAAQYERTLASLRGKRLG